MKKPLLIVALAALFSLPLQAADPAPLSQGEVRKVDAAAQKITLRHGPIASIGMPPMTMVFEVENVELLEGVSAGEKVKFQVQQQGNRYIVTELQVVE
ncbi:MAG: copper-binding protein [Pseudomonadaceae bacterium]